MKTLIKDLENNSQMMIVSETYVDLVQAVCKLDLLLTTSMKDDLISYAYEESKTFGADEEVAFLMYEEGKYVAKLFFDVLVHIQKRETFGYEISLVKQEKEKILFDILKKK